MPINEVNTENLSLLQENYQKFWTVLNRLSTQHPDFSKILRGHPYSSIRSYQDYCFDGPYHIVLKISFSRHEVAVGAYFSNLFTFDECQEKYSKQIEEAIGHRLVWSRHKTKASAYILENLQFDSERGWEGACKWMLDYAIIVKKAFDRYIER